MNKVILIGNSGSDPEIKYTQTGLAVLSLSIATSEKNKEDGWVTTWHKVKAFGKIAEDQSKMIKKGSKVFVEGKISVNEWTDKQGQKKTSVEIIAFTLGVILKAEPEEFDNNQSYIPKDNSPIAQKDVIIDEIPF